MRTSALARALRVIENHPEFIRWCEQVPNPGDGEYALDFEFGIDLRPQWAQSGLSPSGVRPVEIVTVRFADDYPNTAPEFRLRADFPRTFPHLQPGPAEQAPKPCLVLGSETNLFRRIGVGGMLAQLSHWLHAAAHDRLNDDPATWEPARRDRVDDHVIVRLDEVQALPGGRHTWAYRSAIYGSWHLRRDLRLHRLMPLRESVKLTPEFWAGLVQHQSGHDICGGRTLCVILAPSPSGAEPFVADLYRPDSVQDVATLRVALNDWHCVEAFDSLLSSINQNLSRTKRNEVRHPIPIVLLVNVSRPRPLAGTRSSIETMAYVLELNVREGLPLSESSPVRLAAVIEQTSAALLQRFNQQATDQVTRGWATVGCGSLGSKIATLAARQGRAPSVLIDPEFLEPHNYARHALTPGDPKAPNLLLSLKAPALEYEIARLQQKAVAWPMPFEMALADPEKRLKLCKTSDWLLVNTTASVTVRNVLAMTGKQFALPRIAEGALLGAGHVGYWAVTGPDHNPDCGELFAQATHLFGETPGVAEAALSVKSQLDTIRTGMGCGSETMPVSDATITQHAAAMATSLLQLHKEGLPQAGQIWIGLQSLDGMSIQWGSNPVAPFLRVSLDTDDHNPWTLHVAAAVVEKIEADVRFHPTTETGGVLWGCVNEAIGAIYVVDLLDAPPDSKRTATSFELGTHGLEAVKAHRSSQTHGHLHCVGTWHSHLLPSEPSSQDRQVARTIAEAGSHANALLIWTPNGFVGLLADVESINPTIPRA